MKTKFILEKQVVKNDKSRVFKELVTNKYIYLLALPGIVFFFIFNYLPLIGLIIAFQDFNPIAGIIGSKFVGFKNFEFFFSSDDWKLATYNTLFLNILFIITGLIVSMSLAIMLSEIRSKISKKLIQSAVILPHFISWPIIAMFSITLFARDGGMINSILESLGLHSINFYREANIWPTILVIMRIWKAAGFNSIIYLAAITGINQEIYESAHMDGANRLQMIFKLTIPMLANTVILLLLLGVGGIFYGDFGMIYAMVGDNALLFSTTDVIDTYVFRSLRNVGSLGMASAVGLYQSIIGFLIVIITNGIARKHDPESAIF